MKRFYLKCLECGHRCKRTGKKDIAGFDLNDNPIYTLEYECPNCARMYLWNLLTNYITRGSFKQ